MDDQTELTQAPVEPTAEVDAGVKALYEAFVEQTVAASGTNTAAAQASILMLADAIANMSGAVKLPQDQFNDVIGDVLHYLEQVCMNLSHDVAGVVADILAPKEPVQAQDINANMEVKN